MSLISTNEMIKRLLNQNGYLHHLTYNGFNVVVSDLIRPRPVLKISDNFEYCTMEFRVMFNVYLENLFGTTTDCVVIDNNIYMNKETLFKLKSNLNKNMLTPFADLK